MAIIDVLVGYLLYRTFIKVFGAKDSVRAISAFLGGWLGITLVDMKPPIVLQTVNLLGLKLQEKPLTLKELIKILKCKPTIS